MAQMVFSIGYFFNFINLLAPLNIPPIKTKIRDNKIEIIKKFKMNPLIRKLQSVIANIASILTKYKIIFVISNADTMKIKPIALPFISEALKLICKAIEQAGIINSHHRGSVNDAVPKKVVTISNKISKI